jgi:(1->4)-alpha-D-glucan 1-alpha-D-glucosylmutase
MHFQQYTAPVQAKGVEDTAFYRYNLLVSLNEVGGDPSRFGRSPAEFHAAARARSAQWPLEMTATATHDTKLGEDVRARINVLSELPDDWRRALTRWMRINAPNRSVVDADPAPDRNDEYRFYQVLLGTWPADAFADHRPTANTETGAAARAGRGAVSQGRRGAGLQPGDHPAPAYVARLRDYMVKAAKEAKLRTSWVNDNEAYDQAVARFVERSLAGPTSPRFLAAFVPLARRVAHLGMLNALSQVAIKIGSPGVSDFYQGTELWDLRLVDPDNRTPVDYGHRAALLDALGPLLEDADARSAGRKPCAGGQNAGAQAAAVSTLLRHWTDGRIKLFVTAAGLRLRRARPDLFLHGEYLPLEPEITVPGCDVLAFARRLDTSVMLVVAPRLVSALVDLEPPVGSSWGDSTLALPDDLLGGYVNVLTGETVETRGGDRRGTLALADALAVCPVALLLRAS